jgi:hypothetical protein
MTTTNDLVTAALAVADLFRDGDTPDHHEIRQLVRTADAYRMNKDHALDGCLMCAVRTLTEGEPKTWNPDEPASVKGVVIGIGTFASQYTLWDNPIPFVDLWLGGLNRVRIEAYGTTLRNAIEKADVKVGDTLTAEYLGFGDILTGKYAGKTYRKYTVGVERGHH